ncbi:uncharacterized protein LOC117161619 [Bombus vancouverensis nearcticus]|uniref:uncharacterized protein LOC117161619 n=1 Tax=Bombus vancouverensis nearcticus TaxID=2705178 RepID=UPI0014392248|nr:uncharacterized protein LOC117161619 [Bombus vancouverensis nearcticus]
MKTISTVMSSCALLLITAASNINEQCKIHEMTTVDCHCIGNEEFFLPEGYNYENVTTIQIASCNIANLHFSSLTEASQITEIIVQNISERLIFELFLTSKRLKRLKLSRIGRIPLISRDTFVRLKSIETLRIEDTRINNFAERFTDIAITNFSMINVTIERIDQLGFSAKGEILHIKNSEFQNVTGSLNFAYFSTVEILHSKFQLNKPGYILIEGNIVYIEDCVFSNSSANVVAAGSIKINDICADGKSSMRLSSNNIKSVNNRLPTEIIYTKNKNESEHFFSRNNTVCIAGNCKCPKSSGQSPQLVSLFLAYTFQFFLPIVILLSILP